MKPGRQPKLIEGKDYYINEQGFWVFTEAYHLRRGYCCGSGCLHCPYGFDKSTKGSGRIHSTDQMGHELLIPFPPKRIISLVPSQTELLFDLGLEDEVVGITKFCVHPEGKVKDKAKIGGTKKFNLDKIHALQPDLIIGNKEENYPEGINALQHQYPVWMSDIITLEDAYAMISEVSRITNRLEAGAKMVEEISAKFQPYIPFENKPSAACFIWRDPYMVAAGNTFIDEMMTRFGVRNIFSHLSRYPEVSMDDVMKMNPQFIFLSSEPYPFSGKHVTELQEVFPSSNILIVDGQYFSWYGSRLLKTTAYFEELKMKCK